MSQPRNRLVYKTITDEVHIIKSGNVITIRHNDINVGYFQYLDVARLLWGKEYQIDIIKKKEVKTFGNSTQDNTGTRTSDG
ncbi:hypothetical protein CCP1ISM_280002 [Azospirillaceae bacterium]